MEKLDTNYFFLIKYITAKDFNLIKLKTKLPNIKNTSLDLNTYTSVSGNKCQHNVKLI
jgi:hypothetical protein